MKNNQSITKLTTIGFFLFLIPLTIVVSLGVIIFNQLMNSYDNIGYVAIFLALYIIIVTLAFTLTDLIRRKKMIDKPVKQILEATEKISNGNFNVKLIPLHEYSKYDEYDMIMENINKMVKELSESEILKNDFISNVSHEIKTPLANIQNYAKALQKGGLKEEERQKYLNSLILSTNKVSSLISNILKLNKLENQQISTSKEKINLATLLEESILVFEDKINQKEIELECNIEEIVQTVDSSLVEIVFNNLISNAVKFTGNKGKIEISLTDQKNYVVFQVIDNGIGMNKAVGERIFDKFYQADTSHSSEGNGLGLALVKKIIDKLGGEISVLSEEGKGSQFVVKFKKDLYEV